MKICFICGREPEYARNRIILNGLKMNGVEVVECTSSSKSALKRFFSVMLRLPFKKRGCDAVFVGFFGQPLMPFVKLLTRKKIVFDAFLSANATQVFDKQVVKKDSLKARFWFLLDKYACSLADRVLVDTEQHVSYFSKTFGIPKKKISRLFIGADDNLFKPMDVKKNKDFVVEFHGEFIPLQGVEYIIKAAKILEKHKDIKFRIIGKGQTFEMCTALAKKLNLKNVRFEGYMKFTEIPQAIAESDIGLGIFGVTEKAKRVIPNKAYEIIAMKRALITSETPAALELFENRKNVLFCKPSDEKSLAEAILELKNNPKLKEKIAENGYKLFKEKCCTAVLGREVKGVLEEVAWKQ